MLSVSDIQAAETAIFIYVQSTWLSDKTKLREVANLSPIESPDGIYCVGGRLKNAPIPHDAKHPIILPHKHYVVSLIIRYYHAVVIHAGPDITLGEIRQKYWIVKGKSSVKSEILKCIVCKRLKTAASEQYMSDLPKDRVTPNEPPFTNIGVDYFGPLYVKRGRSQIKHYGCLFTCLVTRAIHLELASCLDTSSFNYALQRLVARRGSPKLIRSDNGSNFVGAKRELKEALDHWNQKQINDHLLQYETRWIFNPPAASHHGGVLERQIRTVRSILVCLMKEQPISYESLSTLLCIVEGIVNGRPITKLSDDP